MDPEHYNRTFPTWPPLVTARGWVYGVWLLGRDYRSRTGYYGEFPPGFLKRLRALFPTAQDVLHLFSGRVAKGHWPREYTLDCNPELQPDLVGQAERLPEYVAPASMDLVIADPPYTAADARQYGTPPVNRRRVVQAVVPVLRPGGHLAWLDTVFPMYRKEELRLVGTIGILRSTNHRVRFLFIWQRLS